MSILVVLEFLAFPLITLVGLVLLIVTLVRRPAPAPSDAAAAARRHATTVNVTAWVLAVGINLLLVTVGGPAFLTLAGGGTWSAMLVGLYPATIGLTFLGVHAVGERAWPRPTGPVRRAHLSVRDTPRGPRWLRRLTWTWVGLLVASLVVAGVTSSNGRAVTAPYASNAVVSAGPYPGWYYGVPLLLATLLILAATEGVLRLIARRPAVIDADPDYDAASRGLSAHRALRGTHLVLALTAAGVLSLMGAALGSLSDQGLGVLGGSLGGVAAVVSLVGMVATVIPGQPARTASRPQSSDEVPSRATDDLA